jgi:hypothetical protein
MPQAGGAQAAWAKVRSWINSNAQAFVLEQIPPDRTDADGSLQPLKAYQSYVQLWLADMFLAKRVSWLRTWFPTVHAEVRMPLVADQEAVSFTRVVRPADDKLGEGVRLNYPLTELIPFNGGMVEVETALLGLKGSDDFLAAGVDLLQKLSSLVAPPLGQAIGITTTLATGARDFLDRASGGVHLALHQTFTSAGGGGANVLRPGYLAVVLATANEIPSGQLHVQGDRLYRSRPDREPEPFTSHDYMLLRIEGREEREDWRTEEILTARRRSIEALQRGDKDIAMEFRGAAIAAVLNSSDLTAADQRRIVKALKDEWDELAALGLGAVGTAPIEDLGKLVAKYAMPKVQAAALGPLTPEEAFAT